MIIVRIPEERQKKHPRAQRAPYTHITIKDPDTVVLSTSNGHSVTFDRQTLLNGLAELVELLSKEA